MTGVICDRCGQPADAYRVDVSTYDQPGRWMWGRITRTVKTPLPRVSASSAAEGCGAIGMAKAEA